MLGQAAEQDHCAKATPAARISHSICNMRLSWLCVSLLALLPAAHGATILVYTMPGGSSHLMEILEVVKVLNARRQHRVVVNIDDWDLANSQHKISTDGIEFNVNGAYDTVEEGQRAFDEFLHTPQLDPVEHARIFLSHQAAVCRLFLGNAATMQKVRALRVDLLIADFTTPCAIALAQQLGVPRVTFSPTTLIEPIAAAYYGYPAPPSSVPAYGSAFTPHMTFKQRVANFLLHQAMLLVVDPMARRLDADMRRDLGMPPPRPAALARNDVRLLLANADPALEYPRPLPPMVKLIGPLLAKPAQPLPPALQALMDAAGPRGAVFVSFGSVFTLSNVAEATALASALSSLNRTILWRITEAELPTGLTLAALRLPPSVHTLRWAPQNDILGCPALAVFVTHGGTNSVYEAAYHGVPVVNIPFIADHADHSAKAEFRGFGITVPRASLSAGDPGPLVAAVERAAAEPSLRESAAKVGRLLRAHPKPAAERAADWVEYALAMPRDGSLSLVDAAAELPWAVRASVDVYAALVLLVVLVLLLLVGIGQAAASVLRRARRRLQSKEKRI